MLSRGKCAAQARVAQWSLGHVVHQQTPEQATKARDDVLGIVAHDLRSPLNGLLLNLQVLCGAWRSLQGCWQP